MKPTTIFIVFILFISSCKKEKEAANFYADCPYGKSFITMNDPFFISNGLIPFQLNLTWYYADSTWENGALKSAGEYSLSVVSARKSGNDTWWKLSDSSQLCVSNDTVYKLNSSGFVPEGTVVCPEKTILFYPVPADTTISWHEITQDMSIVGEATQLKGTIHTGIGDFGNCLEFKQNLSGSYSRIIKPGIGIVKFITISNGRRNEKTLLIDLVPEK